jgi:cytolysin (calcineurin-like family phosphatase)
MRARGRTSKASTSGAIASKAIASGAIAAGLCVWLGLAAAPAAAWKLYNDSLSKVDFEVYDDSNDLVERGTIDAAYYDSDGSLVSGTHTCGWSEKDCNPKQKRSSVLTVILRRDDSQWACSLTMLGGGYALVYRVTNGNLPAVLWCHSQVYEGSNDEPLDVNGDSDSKDYVDIDWSDASLYSSGRTSGEAGYTSSNRSVRFLVTGDPQVDNAGVSDECHFREWCTYYDNPDNNAYDEEQDTYDTMVGLTDYLRSYQHGYRRWNSDVRGIIVSGDLTQNTRWDEFKYYTQMSTAGNVFTNNDFYPKKHPATDLIPLQEKLYEGLGNHDLGVDSENDNIVCQTDLDARYGYQDCNRKIEDYVAGHSRGAKRTSWRDETPHYSWEWDDVHFVQLNVFPGDFPSSEHPEHDPQAALAYLAEDLAENVGRDSNRPVVLIHHYGFDDFSQRNSSTTTGCNDDAGRERWWTDFERLAYWNTIADYNVIGIFTGHLHLSGTSSERYDTTYGTTSTGEECTNNQGWRSDFRQPLGGTARWDGATQIPAFVAGSTIYGMYLDVTIGSCNEMVVTRSDGDQETVDFYAPGDISLSCDPTASCIDVVSLADGQCQSTASIAGLAAFGICTQTPDTFSGVGTFTADLDCVNSDGTLTDTCSAFVTVEDTWGPDLTCPDIGGAVLQCGDPVGWKAIDVADNCDPTADQSLTCNVAEDAIAKLWMDGRAANCRAYDNLGNEGRCQTADRFQVVDTLAPELTLNGNALDVVECKPGLYQDPLTDATDRCEATLERDRFPREVSTSTPGQTVITYEAKDSSGNVASVRRTVQVVDTTAPEVFLDGPADDVAECGSGPYQDLYGSANDVCDPTLALTRTPAVVGTVSTGSLVLTYEARDSSGNVGSATRLLEVKDTLPPQIVLVGPAEATAECVLDATWVDPGARAQDQCFGPQDVETIGGAALGRVGQYKVTYQAVDDLQLVGRAERWVNVQDTQPPGMVLLGEEHPILQCGVTPYQERGAEARDACSGELSVTQSGAPVDNTVVGTYARDYTAVDGVGLSVVRTRLVEVADTLAPGLLCEDVVVEPTGPDGAAVTFSALANDQCDPAPVVTCPQSGATFAVGTETAVFCSARDAQGNRSVCSLTVKVYSQIEMVGVLVAHVEALLTSGSVSNGQARSMQRKLDTVVRAIEDGRTTTACDQLAALQDQIRSWVNGGTLTAEQAFPAQASATNLQATLGCPEGVEAA